MKISITLPYNNNYNMLVLFKVHVFKNEKDDYKLTKSK